MGLVKNIRNAAKKEQYWRAAAWALERCFPEKYARRGPDVITAEQIGLLLTKFAERLSSRKCPIVTYPRNRQKRWNRDGSQSWHRIREERETGPMMHLTLTHRWSNGPTEAEPSRRAVGDVGATTWPANTARPGGWPVAAKAALDLLAWGQKYLPDHFCRPPSNMHRWLAEQLDAAHTREERSSTCSARAAAPNRPSARWPCRSAQPSSVRESFIWIVSDTKHQACAHLENIKAELLENRRLARDFPDAVGRGLVGGAT